jgi:hypothetical protein
MFTIGEFARHGRVSVRMLRHHDATGLLRPAQVNRARLVQVEARLQIIEREGAMPADDVQVKQIPAVRVAELTATAASLEPASITPVIRPLYAELGSRLGRAGITSRNSSIRWAWSL